MTEPTKRAWATIDSSALQKNLALVQSHCPEAAIFPVIKANAYGHGMSQVAQMILAARTRVAGLAVATLAEALQLRQQQTALPILLMGGFVNADELSLCLQNDIEPVVHSVYQLDLLEQCFSKDILGGKRRLWLKFNSGMNRLGMSAGDCLNAYQNLRKYPGTEFVLMSHFACADDPDNAHSREFTQQQLGAVKALQQELQGAGPTSPDTSLAASAGILSLPQSHFQIVRPGVMLYGSSPLVQQTGEEVGLQPVMTLSSRLMAIYAVAAGAAIGYGASYVCQRDTRVGVVAIGYGDGYPRSAVNGTPVVVKTAGGSIRTRLIGLHGHDYH
jgi:alanine racemase